MRGRRTGAGAVRSSAAWPEAVTVSRPAGRGFEAASSARFGARAPLVALVLWSSLLASVVGLGYAGRDAAPLPSGPASVVPSPPAPSPDAVLVQALEWEREYREKYPTMPTLEERAHYRDWQRQYEQQHPQS